jgi:TonB-dependent SusC/RagA subfamily outer membrane receptor
LKKLQLVLTNPCTKQWNELMPNGEGRYCNSCEKNLVDLSNKTDAELINFFKRKNNNVCGRLLSTQLNRELVLPPAKIGWQWLMPLAIGAMIVSPAQANELKPVIEQLDLPSRTADVLVKQPIPVHIFRGTVIDEGTGKPLNGVKVRQKGFGNVMAVTDSTGKFEVNFPDVKLARMLTFELSGYGKVEAEVNNEMVVKMAFVRMLILGGISSVSLNREPLYMVYAGKKSCSIAASRIKEIKPEWIEKIDILKDVQATALYGSKAANGVILIEIKTAYVKKIDFTQK